MNHSAGEYVRGMAHTNGVESFWSMLKRGYQGTFHHFSETAYAHGSGRESLPPDVEVEVRAGERVECSLYVPADGATT